MGLRGRRPSKDVHGPWACVNECDAMWEPNLFLVWLSQRFLIALFVLPARVLSTPPTCFHAPYEHESIPTLLLESCGGVIDGMDDRGW